MQCDAQIQHLLEAVWHQNYHGFSDYIRDTGAASGGSDMNRHLSLMASQSVAAPPSGKEDILQSFGQMTHWCFLIFGKWPLKFWGVIWPKDSLVLG